MNVDGKRNPMDAFWEKQYHQPGFRSYTSAGMDGTVNIYPEVNRQTQYRAALPNGFRLLDQVLAGGRVS